MLTTLIAEDELLVSMGISSSVPWSALDIAVVGEARDGMEAWELYQNYHPDIIVLDILMPGMNGVELLRRIRANDRRCAVIIVTNVYSGRFLDEAMALGVSVILHKMTMKRDDIYEAVRNACQALRPGWDNSSSEAADEKDAWEAFLFGTGADNTSLKAQGLIGFRLFSDDRLTPAIQRSLIELFLQRLGEPEAYVHIVRERCELLIRRERPAKQVSESELVNIARYVQDNFHVNLGVVTLLGSLQNDRLPDMARRFVRLLHEPRLFDRPVLVLDAKGNYCNERLNMLRSDLAIRLPVCSDRDGILALKIKLDQYPGELDGSFRRLLRSAAPLLESLNLPLARQGLWEMTQWICESAEERLRQASPRIRQEIYRAMAYIQTHMTESIQREQIGKIVNYDSAYFSKLFKRELGMSCTDYLLHVRMLRAQELLSETDMPISFIATQCGYTDCSYFSGRFRQFCGVTPHEWREDRREAMA